MLYCIISYMIDVCEMCGKIKRIRAKNKCKTCYERPYVEEFRARLDYPQKRKQYDQTRKVKLVLCIIEN